MIFTNNHVHVDSVVVIVVGPCGVAAARPFNIPASLGKTKVGSTCRTEKVPAKVLLEGVENKFSTIWLGPKAIHRLTDWANGTKTYSPGCPA